MYSRYRNTKQAINISPLYKETFLNKKTTSLQHYSLFQFNQASPLYNITAYIYFTDQYNNIYPLPIDNGLSANIKFMFIKKNLIKNILTGKI